VLFAPFAEFFELQAHLDCLFIFPRKIINAMTIGALKLDEIFLRHKDGF
jgi:hypothetical protein